MVKRKRTESRARQDEVLAAQISEIKAEHPFWGYRRVWAYLRYREGQKINEKRVYRVMREHKLLCERKGRPKRASREGRSKPCASRPNQYWGTDMTKIYVEGHGWMYLVIVLDWFSKKIVGFHADMRSRSTDWLKALDQAVNAQFPKGVKGHKLKLVSDNGCQPSSNAYHRYCLQTEIEQIFTSYGNPKGNADTERVIRTMKEEVLWLNEWSRPEDVVAKTRDWIRFYNERYPHSSLSYRSPNEAEADYFVTNQEVA